VGVRLGMETQRARRVGLRGFSDFCDSTSISNCASPLNSFPPGQGLKSGGNGMDMVASTIQFLTADAKTLKVFKTFRVYLPFLLSTQI
jgi:hypothetical protein